MTRGTVARGVLNVTGGCKYPSGYWLAAPHGDGIPGDCPASFRDAAASEWVAWVAGERERWYASLDSGAPPEWNARGIASKLAGRAGGAWSGPAHVVQSLVSEELAQYWTEVAPRLNRQQYIANAWEESKQMRTMTEWHGVDRWGADLDAADIPATIARGAYAGIAWERTADGWRAMSREDGGVAVPLRAEDCAGGGIDAALDVLRASGVFTDRMLELIGDTYTAGATGRGGRIIAAAGDWVAAVARGAGSTPEASKRGRAVAAAADCLTAALQDLDRYVAVAAYDDEPF